MWGIGDHYKRHGLASTLHWLAIRALNKLIVLKVFKGIWVERPDPKFLECPKGYSGSFVAPEALRRFADDPVTQISHEFLREALSRGDECYGFLHDGALAAYGWYARGRTPVSAELDLVFTPRYVYMYKGFTDDGHRGQRLHAVGMTRALQHYVSKGYGGVVSYVESTNFDSIKSCLRMGYGIFGSIVVVRLFGRWFSISSPGCRRFAFRVEPRGGA